MQAIIGKQYPKMVIPLIDKSVKSIKIVVFDWRWYADDPANPCQLFNASIIRAQKRGVQVSACVNSNAILQPLLLNGIGARLYKSKNLMHSKFIVIDDKILITGSHNFSQNAFTLNLETSIITDEPESVNEFLTFFDSIWSL